MTSARDLAASLPAVLAPALGEASAGDRPMPGGAGATWPRLVKAEAAARAKVDAAGAEVDAVRRGRASPGERATMRWRAGPCPIPSLTLLAIPY